MPDVTELRQLYETADSFAREVGELRSEVPIPAHNELRYAGTRGSSRRRTRKNSSSRVEHSRCWGYSSRSGASWPLTEEPPPLPVCSRKSPENTVNAGVTSASDVAAGRQGALPGSAVPRGRRSPRDATCSTPTWTGSPAGDTQRGYAFSPAGVPETCQPACGTAPAGGDAVAGARDAGRTNSHQAVAAGNTSAQPRSRPTWGSKP